MSTTCKTDDPRDDPRKASGRTTRAGRSAATFAALSALAIGSAAPAAATDVPVSVTITSVECTQEDECRNAGLEAAGESWPDFYAKIFLNGVEGQTNRADDDQSRVTPLDWTVSAVIDDTVTPVVPVTIQIWDHDSTSGDDLADASPQSDHNNLDFIIDLATGRWSGDLTTACVTGDGVDTDDDEYYPVKVCVDVSVLSTSGDLDGDGLLDGWERFGYDADGDGAIDVDLPAMGASPTRKDLFLELDYEAGRAPTRDGIQAMKNAFAAAPVSNPVGPNGITLHVDVGFLVDPNADEAGLKGTCTNGIDDDGDGLFDGADTSCFYLDTSREVGVGDCADPLNADEDGDGLANGADPDCRVGDNFGGGGLVATVGSCGIDAPFYAAKALNFAANRSWIFHYAIQAASVFPAPTPAGCAGGQGEVGGNDFVSHNFDAGTLLHELGHNLSLDHGGLDTNNCKPNYISVMNYNNQSGIPRRGGGGILDYSPVRMALDGSTRAAAPLATLLETNLDETLIEDPSDTANQLVFLDGANWRTTAPVNLNPNWTGDLDPPFESGVTVNIDSIVQGFGLFPPVGPPACLNNVTNIPLVGADDWAAISLPFRQFGASADGAINASDETGGPTEADLQLMQDALRTTDMAVGLSAAPDPVAAGTELTYVMTASNLGPNPALAVRATVVLPPETQRTGALPVECVEAVPGTAVCDFGEMLAGAARSVRFVAAVPADLVYNAGAPVAITATGSVEDSAGFDPDPSSNVVQTSVTAVAVADLSVELLAILNPPTRMRVREEVVISLAATIASAGPSSPMDTLLTQTGATDPGATISATWVETSQKSLALGAVRSVDIHPIISCQRPGLHRFDLGLIIDPARVPDSDPDASNNAFGTAIEVECLGPDEVTINLQPGQSQNRLYIAGRDGILAILTTAPGEYGRADAFDARDVDPETLSIGSRRMVAGLERRTSRFGDIASQDSFEPVPPETFQDGDDDLVIFSFDVSDTGLTISDTEVCITGKYGDHTTGEVRDFFGCDQVTMTP